MKNLIIRLMFNFLTLFLIVKEFDYNLILLSFIPELFLGNYKYKNEIACALIVNYLIYKLFNIQIIVTILRYLCKIVFSNNHAKNECGGGEPKNNNWKAKKESNKTKNWGAEGEEEKEERKDSYKTEYQRQYTNPSTRGSCSTTHIKDSYSFSESRYSPEYERGVNSFHHPVRPFEITNLEASAASFTMAASVIKDVAMKTQPPVIQITAKAITSAGFGLGIGKMAEKVTSKPNEVFFSFTPFKKN